MFQKINSTIPKYFDKICSKYPENMAVIYPESKFKITYKQLDKMTDLVAKSFLKLGIRTGDHVAIWATNYPQWILTQIATAKIGAVLVTINTNYKMYELEYILNNSDSSTLITIDGFKDSNYIEILYHLCPELKNNAPGNINSDRLPKLKNVIYIGERSHKGMFRWKDILKTADSISDEYLNRIKESLTPDQVINIQYTSGTTGFPKGVMLTHENLLNNAMAVADCMNLNSKDRLCIPVPLFHCFGCVMGVLSCITKGATMVPLEHYNPIRVLQTLDNEKCTALHGVPTMFINILEQPSFRKYDLSNLTKGIMAGSLCPTYVLKKVIKSMNMKEITIAYGQTEASPVITQTRIDDCFDRRVNTVGRPLPGIEVKIVDPDTGKRLPHGCQGELCARGYNVMKGYYRMEQETKKVIDDEGWLHTGDLAFMDKYGYCTITGRIKDMIIRGGENIYPKEIEEFLYTHPCIKEAQIVGVPDEKYGEEIMAFIKLKSKQRITKTEIKKFVKKNMARYKVPKYIEFIDEFPMTASGKIQKFKLREKAILHTVIEEKQKRRLVT